ncbi:MAG: DNA glycosylase, partial [Anaeromassilibacillus sp.]
MSVLRDFDLTATLECGQCFRWDRQLDGSYRGIAGGRLLCIAENHTEEAEKDPF